MIQFRALLRACACCAAAVIFGCSGQPNSSEGTKGSAASSNLESASISEAGAPTAVSSGGPRFALLIGNEDYPAGVRRLSNPHNDVKAMAEALELVGFSGRITRLPDADADGIREAVTKFAEEVQAAGPGATALFYYSGHGAAATVQSSGGRERRNYIMPAKTNITSEAGLIAKGVDVEQIIDALAAAGAAATIIVIDACRNEFSKGGGDKGAAPVPRVPGMLIAHATSDGSSTADDGLFAQSLAREIPKPGQYVSRTFELAFAEFAQKTGGTPNFSPLLPNFCFNQCPGEAIGPAPQVDLPAPALTPSIDSERLAWEQITDDCEAKLFLTKFPNGAYRAAAEIRAERCEQQNRMRVEELERSMKIIFDEAIISATSQSYDSFLRKFEPNEKSTAATQLMYEVIKKNRAACKMAVFERKEIVRTFDLRPAGMSDAELMGSECTEEGGRLVSAVTQVKSTCPPDRLCIAQYKATCEYVVKKEQCPNDRI